MSATAAETRAPCPDPQTLRKLLCDDLAPAEAGRVEEHVGTCPGCQQVLQRLVGSLSDTVVSPLPGPPARADDAPPELPGYEPLGRIGAGGMGVVWRVRDLQFGRRLAVKVMKSWAYASPGLIERFVGEARVCGQLAHPYIVPVHAMGRLPDGRPYYAMKLVEGRTLAALLEGGPAPAERRMGLVQVFGQVCQAVAYAHGQGVIHRDLKPDNVMVGAHGEVQLMDWGLAKVLGEARSGEAPAAGPTDEDAARTHAGSVLGTPAYMPPEQARGEVAAVDQRSDVFSLGAILCEILSGQPPYADADVKTALRRAGEADLGAALARLRGCGADPELVGLAERCLAPQKAGRPADAGEVAAAVAAYVSGVEERLQQERLRRERQQVQAAEERRRRELWVGLAAAVLVVLVAGIVGTAVGLFRADRARDAEAEQRRIAEGQKERAVGFRDKALDALRATTGEDVEKLIAAKPELGPDERAYLEAILRRWQAFAAQEGDDEQSRALRGEGHAQVARLWQKLGRLDEARGEYEQARDIRQELAEQTPAPPQAQLDLALTRGNLGAVLYALGKWDEARVEYEQALDLQHKLAAQAPASPEARQATALAHSNLGVLLHFALGQPHEARLQYEQARDIQQQLAEQFPAVPDYQSELSATHANLGLVLAAAGQRDEARVEYGQALDRQQKLAARFPAVPAHLQRLAVIRINLGVLLNELGKPEEARLEYERARDIEQKLAARFPSVPDYQYQLSRAHHNLAYQLDALGKWDAARHEYEQARDVLQELAARFPAVHTYQVELGSTYNSLGQLIRDRQGQPADSLPWFDKAVGTLTVACEKESRDVTAKRNLRNSYWNRAQALDGLRKHAEAMKDWHKAIELSPEPEAPLMRAARATSLVKAGRVAEGVADMDELTRAGEWSAEQWYDFACFYAVTSGKATDKKRAYADRAMELLRKAVQAGFGSGAQMAKDADLDPLRDREDYRQLLKDLGAKAPAPGPGSPQGPSTAGTPGPRRTRPRS
jgi:tetratricopeptide (TPR) repeat protein